MGCIKEDERGEGNSILSGITHLLSTGCIMNGIAAGQQGSRAALAFHFN